MKTCANKDCRRAGQLLSDDQFNRDKSKPDGLCRLCRECNALRCRRWYEADPDAHRQMMLERKQGRDRSTERKPGERIPRVSPIDASLREEQASEFRLLRFTPSQWDWLNEQAGYLDISVERMLQLIVSDEMARRKRAEESE